MKFVLTGHDSHTGQAHFVAEDYVPGTDAIAARVFWATHQTPAPWDAPAQPERWAELGTPPPAAGTKFVHLSLPVGYQGVLHQSDTVDYAIVTRGIVLASVGASDIELGPGDVVVQRGTLHAWSNVGTEQAELLVVLVDGWPNRPDSLKPGERASASQPHHSQRS